MKKSDLIFILCAIALFAPFFLFPGLYRCYEEANRAHPYILAFFKFAILSTAGESLGLRLQKGRYHQPGFGLLPRAVVWGVLGIWIAAAMKLYAAGVSGFLEIADLKILRAFLISVWMNTTFAPIFMTCHKVTDTHIRQHNGSIKALITPLRFGKILSEIDWQTQWNFVFKKTIPLFWIPAHTITFLLPPEWQVLFAAFLGVALGVLLSVAAIKQQR